MHSGHFPYKWIIPLSVDTLLTTVSGRISCLFAQSLSCAIAQILACQGLGSAVTEVKKIDCHGKGKESLQSITHAEKSRYVDSDNKEAS